MGAGVSSAVARALGAGKRERADEIVFHAFLLALALAAIFSIVMLLAAPFIFRWMGGRDKMLADALSYANVALGGAVCITVLNLLGNAVRGTGNMSLHAGVLVGCVVAHIAMSPVLIFGWGPFPALGSCRRGLGSGDPVRRRQPHHDRLPALLTFDRSAQLPRYGAALGAICRYPQGRRARLGEHGHHQSVSRGADGHRRTVRSASCHRLRHGRAPRIHHATRSVWLRHRDCRDGWDELGRAAVWPRSPDRVDRRDHDGNCVRDDRIDCRAATQPLDRSVQR